MFQEEVLQQAMDDKGFCILPLLNTEAIQSLKQLYEKYVEDGQIAGMYANHNRNEVEKSKLISKEIIDIVEPFLQKKFHNIEPFVAHFVVKAANTEQEFSLHQDWNIVDEKAFNSYHIWIPLAFSSAYNGGMFVLPGSHKFFENHRSGSFGTPVVASDEILQELIEPINIAETEALVWHDATFHGSFPNKSSQNRISVVLVIHEKEAISTYQHYDNSNGTLNTYLIDSSSLLENLSVLEKGNIPNSWLPKQTILFSQMSNANINSTVLLNEHQKNGKKLSPLLPILKKDSIQKELSEKGFVVLPFIDEGVISKIKTVLESESSYKRFNNQGRYTSMESESPTIKQRISAHLSKILQPFLDNIFIEYKTPIFQFFIKMPNSDGDIPLHTDTTLVLNPGLEAHYGLWIPLLDVSENNGTLTIIEGSHLWYKGISTNSHHWPFFSIKDSLNLKAIPLNLKEGSIVIFDNRLIHGSTFNKSSLFRISVVGRVMHMQTKLYSYFKDKEETNFINVYAEEENFYLNELFQGDKNISPTGQYLGKVACGSLVESKMPK